MTGISGRTRALLLCVALSTGCSTADVTEPDLGVAWVRTSAEFDAISLQVYQAATKALEEKIADRSWSALPDQSGADELPPAIIFDVDETVVSNVEFQLTLKSPFSDRKLYEWSKANTAEPVAGVAEFSRRARQLGVTLFFLTNRPCEAFDDTADTCPSEAVTVQDVTEAGVPTDAAHVMLAYEQPDWPKEKKVRRDAIAKDYRVIMLMGDDLGDFIPCTRKRPSGPCSDGATIASRRMATFDHRDYWGNGWYVLPNPMHGSWITVE